MPIEENKCLTNGCRKYTKEKINAHIIVPFEDNTEEIRKLLSYFQYLAPNIESIHSSPIQPRWHSSIIEGMLKGRQFEYQRFCSANANIEKELRKAYLYGNDICIKCKRFVCKRKQTRNEKQSETDLECFLRHIRNAIAHGRVYLWHVRNKIHFIFEDENTTGNLSARIVCIKADLEHWKKVLIDKRYY